VVQELKDQFPDYKYHKEAEAAGQRAVMTVALRVRDTLIGMMALGYGETNSITQAHVEIAREIADQIAIAFDNARLITRLREANENLQVLSRRLVRAQEDERRRIARELHDEIGQTLTGLNLALEMDGREDERLTGERRQMIQQMVNGLTQRVRELSLDLRPAMLDDLGLLPALRWLFRRYSEQTGIEVQFSQHGFERRFEPELETAVFRIVQEALTNIARHAQVKQASVDLWANHRSMTVQIEDRGAGFDLEAQQANVTSAGLLGMRERASLLDGELIIDSQPGAGTAIIGRFKLVAQPDENTREA
jgi:signal transduction histidine kinase